MAKVTFVLGLAGSGKSFRADEMVRAGEADIAIHENLLSPDHTEQRDLLVAALRAGKSCVATEMELCRGETRDWFVRCLKSFVLNVEVEWLCIENDLEKANRNCRGRPEKDPEAHVRINKRYCPLYTYPEGSPVLTMWTS